MKRKIIAASMAVTMLISMAATTAYAEDIVVGATAAETPETAAAAEPEIAEPTAEPAAEATESGIDTYDSTLVNIGIMTFPDDVFRQYVRDNFDTDNDGWLDYTEIANAKTIALSNQNVESLKGIEYFTALTKLSCSSTKITSLDVSKNTALTELDCHSNQITSLDVSNNTALTKLDCHYNQIAGLYVSNNTALTSLLCSDNKLTSLDVSNNTALKELRCENNQLASLDVSKNTALTALYCGSNHLASLDVTNNTALTVLYCHTNHLTSLDVSKNVALTSLSCSINELTSLDVRNCTALTQLVCGLNQLTGLDVSQNTALEWLWCQENKLSNLDVSKCTALTWLLCNKNQLTGLDVSQNTALTSLECEDNCLPALNLENNKQMTSAKYTPQAVKQDGVFDVAALVGQANLSRVSDIKTSTNGGEYYYDVKGTYADRTAMPKMQVTVEAATPSTGTSGFVDRLYSVCLGRQPDAAGKADWVARLTSYQISGAKAAYGFIFSEEFKNKNYSNADYVEHLYEAFMGRASDAAGKADWVGKLEEGAKREYVFYGFANSREFDNICESYGIVSKDIETFVTRLYSVCLDRQPDENGLTDWANQLRSGAVTGKAAASGFVFSKEFIDKNYSNEDYVEHLYAAFMGRASDAAGKADWVGKLKSGVSREDVFNGFAGSAEFDAICSGYGIVRG